jgi:hypothetical protein
MTEGFREKIEEVVEELVDLAKGSGHHQAGQAIPADASDQDHLNAEAPPLNPADGEQGVVEDETPA